MIRSRKFAAFLPLFFLVAACNRTEPTPSVDQPLGLGAELAPLEVPAQPGSAHPQLTTSSKGAILSWLDQDESHHAPIHRAHGGNLVGAADGLDWQGLVHHRRRRAIGSSSEGRHARSQLVSDD